MTVFGKSHFPIFGLVDDNEMESLFGETQENKEHVMVPV